MALKSCLLVVKIVALWLALTFFYILAASLSGLSQTAQAIPATPATGAATQAAPDPMKVLLPLLFMCLLVALVVSYLILRSRGHGWKLAGAVFLGIYGVMTVLSQIETVIYLRHKMPPGMIVSIFVMGAIVAALFSPVAVLVLGKWRSAEPGRPTAPMPIRKWVSVFALIGVVYLVLYMGFGYYVAWKNPAVREYYGGADPGSFLAQMKSIWDSRPWMFLLQIARGMLWALLVLPMIRLMDRSPRETALAMALFCGMWSSMLLLPNPLMPEAVARTHLYETLWSNLIFGAVLGWLLGPEPAAAEPKQALARAA